MLKLAESHVLSINPYIPGRPIDSSLGSFTWAKLASNENCLGPSPCAVEAALRGLHVAHLYPNARRSELILKICSHLSDFNIQSNQVALGNGTSELIVNLVRGLVGPQEAVMFGWPTFVMYRQAAQAHGCKEITIPTLENMSLDLQSMASYANKKSDIPVKLIFLPNPNNPTGTYINSVCMSDFIKSLRPDIVLVIDEAYFEYVREADYPNGLVYALNRPRTVVLRTFSKIYGLAGLRIGMAIGDERIIDVLCRIRDPFNVNSAGQHAAIAALDDRVHVRRSIEHNGKFLPILRAGLNSLGFRTFDSVGNFILAQRDSSMPEIAELCQNLYAKGIIIRPLKDFGLNDHVRISVGTEREIAQLFEGLREIF